MKNKFITSPSPPGKKIPDETMNPSVSNKFPQPQPLSVQVNSPQGKLTDHHKRDC